MRQVIAILFLFSSSWLHAAVIHDNQQLITEVQKITEERHTPRSNQAFQELMQSLLESKNSIAEMPEEDYQQHLQIYLRMIELREYLGQIRIDAQGNCVASTTRQNFAQSPLLQQDIQAASTRDLFMRIYRRMCQP